MILTMIWLKIILYKIIRLFQSYAIIPNISMIKMLSQSVTYSLQACSRKFLAEFSRALYER